MQPAPYYPPYYPPVYPYVHPAGFPKKVRKKSKWWKWILLGIFLILFGFLLLSL